MKRTLTWAARIIAMLLILFLSMFALNVFDGTWRGWGLALVLFMHIIPSLLILVALLFLLVCWLYQRKR